MSTKPTKSDKARDDEQRVTESTSAPTNSADHGASADQIVSGDYGACHDQPLPALPAGYVWADTTATKQELAGIAAVATKAGRNNEAFKAFYRLMTLYARVIYGKNAHVVSSGSKSGGPVNVSALVRSLNAFA